MDSCQNYFKEIAWLKVYRVINFSAAINLRHYQRVDRLHKAKSWGERTPHGTSSALADTSFAQGKGLHVQGRLDQVRNMFDDNLPSDIETAKGTSFDDVTWIVGFARIDGEGFIVGDIHLWTEKVQEHEPGADESVLINTGKEACQILVDQNEVGINRCFSQDGQ